MIRSMTAFARHQSEQSIGQFHWEIRSVNHRYLEVSLRLDDTLRPLEMDLRKLISSRLARGKIDATLRFQPPEADDSIQLDTQRVRNLSRACDEINEYITNAAPIDALRILQWPGVMMQPQQDEEAFNAAVVSSLESVLEDLVATREREGAELEGMISSRCQQITSIANAVREQMPVIIEQQRQRLQEKVSDMQVDLESERLEQEMVLLAQKSDVAEELDRLQSHVREVQKVLQRDEPVGRRLDFLMQELNREANTLGSKSIDTGTTRYSVDLKVLIEQMREQIQNIE